MTLNHAVTQTAGVRIAAFLEVLKEAGVSVSPLPLPGNWHKHILKVMIGPGVYILECGPTLCSWSHAYGEAHRVYLTSLTIHDPTPPVDRVLRLWNDQRRVLSIPLPNWEGEESA